MKLVSGFLVAKVIARWRRGQAGRQPEIVIRHSIRLPLLHGTVNRRISRLLTVYYERSTFWECPLQ
jgi:hypothetical protein